MSELDRFGMASGVVPPYPCNVSYNGVNKPVSVGPAIDMVKAAIGIFAIRTTTADGDTITEYPDRHYNFVLFHSDGQMLEADEKPIAGEQLYMRPRTVGGGSVGYEKKQSDDC